MKRNWTEEELVERWTLFPDELALVGAKTGHTRLGFAVMVRFFAGEGRFPRDKHEVSAQVLRFVGEQVGAPDAGVEGWLRYDWSGRSVKYHRAQIREFFGFREATARVREHPPATTCAPRDRLVLPGDTTGSLRAHAPDLPPHKSLRHLRSRHGPMEERIPIETEVA